MRTWRCFSPNSQGFKEEDGKIFSVKGILVRENTKYQGLRACLCLAQRSSGLDEGKEEEGTLLVFERCQIII